MIARNEATEAQIRAADPALSTWLAANAGSGKTRVLTDRVARLLLNGVEPQHILCLTYTKAAASEMQNRLFSRLGAWAMLEDDKLVAALVELGVTGDITADRLIAARTLFARAIETPGGLKIQTIHSFCASLLRRFPLEARVSPQFREMEDRAADLLRDEIIEDMADGADSALLDQVAGFITDTGFESLTRAVTNLRVAFETPLSADEIWPIFGLTPGFDGADLMALAHVGEEADLLKDLIPVLRTGAKTDNGAADKLNGLDVTKPASLSRLESIFLFGEKAKAGPFSAKIDSFPTKALRLAHPDLIDRLNAWMARIEATRQSRLSLNAARKSLALHRFAAVFLPEYERRKLLRGWLDFDDLIQKARQLLNDPSVAAWVLFRLDGGIDHILVDEAQDTSPAQWDVIEKLAQEFTSGEGARAGVERTIFVVGDKKQSIYSFQGADPDAFDQMQNEFSRRLANAGNALWDRSLEFSFRSAETILQLVDAVFTGKTDAGFGDAAQHRAFKSDLPGRIDLWPVVPKAENSDDRHWSDPVDRTSARHHDVILAERIASEIKRLIETGETTPMDGPEPGQFRRRPITPGDILILVQRRSTLFAEIIRACKAADLPIAGADRLKVGAELAVKDLAALLSFLATPEDDLSLATVLRSPLCGWSEQDLFSLAHPRGKGRYLWQALRDQADQFPETLAMLNDLRGQTDFLRPFDLIERCLTRHDGRLRLLGRLGTEAEDGINALLSQALAYERSEVPSLTGFLMWMETDDLEIKRQMGSAGDMIRVMTVHGAKGLEAPIVILPDTNKRKPPNTAEIVMAGDAPLWRTNAGDMPDALLALRDAARDKAERERLRLLYVAMTRAEKWLIVAAAGDVGEEGESWYQIIRAAMEELPVERMITTGGEALRRMDDGWTTLDLTVPERPAPKQITLPDFAQSPVVPASPAPEVLKPSDLGGAKALPGAEGEDEETAMRRGTQIHLLLEHLPCFSPDQWQAAAHHLLGDSADLDLALKEASAVLNNPVLEPIFAPDTLSEVPVTMDLGGRRLRGVIDRLVIAPDHILVVDFKTNMHVPQRVEDCPEGLLRQMGAYALALAEIYPERRIETAILWTRTRSLMGLPHDIVTTAVKRAPHLDLGALHS